MGFYHCGDKECSCREVTICTHQPLSVPGCLEECPVCQKKEGHEEECPEEGENLQVESFQEIVEELQQLRGKNRGEA